MLKLITTGNQLSPDMIQPDHFPDWGPNIQKVKGNLKTLRKAIPVRTLQTTDTAWEVSLKTSVEMYTIWEMTGVLKALETMDENLYDVIQDFIEEKREEYEELLEEREEEQQ
jgi:heterodisulfide reductase subunit C